MLTNILLTSILVLLLLVIVAISIIFFRAYRAFNVFISPSEPGKPSPMALAVDAASAFIARALLAQFKGFLMGLQSGQSRGEKAIQGDLIEGLAAQNPIAAVLMSFPALRKSLRRNPSLMDVALSALSNKMGLSHSSNGDNEKSGSPKFKL